MTVFSPDNPVCNSCPAKTWVPAVSGFEHGKSICDKSKLNTRNENGRFRVGEPSLCPEPSKSFNSSFTAESVLRGNLREIGR